MDLDETSDSGELFFGELHSNGTSPSDIARIDLGVFQNVLTMVAYGLFTLLLLFPRNRFFPFPRSTASIGCAMFIWLARKYGGKKPLLTISSIDFSMLILLSAMMMLRKYVDAAGIQRKLYVYFSNKSHPIWRMLRLAIASSIIGSTLTNDVACFLLIESAFKCRLHEYKNKTWTYRDPFPYFCSVAAFCNIGSQLMVFGNPQNALIYSYGKDGEYFTTITFFLYMIVPVVVASLIHFLWFSAAFLPFVKDTVSGKKPKQMTFLELFLGPFKILKEIVFSLCTKNEEVSVNAQGFKPLLSRPSSQNNLRDDNVEVVTPHISKLIGVILVLVLMVIFMLLEFLTPPALALMALMTMSIYNVILWKLGHLKSHPRGDPNNEDEEYMEIEDFIKETAATDTYDVNLMILFVGLFITISGINDTGYPDSLFKSLFPGGFDNSYECCLKLAFIVAFMSNLFSNVPVIGILKPSIDAITDPKVKRLMWFVTSLSATFAGNLTLIGSAANLIVSEGATQKIEKERENNYRFEPEDNFLEGKVGEIQGLESTKKENTHTDFNTRMHFAANFLPTLLTIFFGTSTLYYIDQLTQ